MKPMLLAAAMALMPLATLAQSETAPLTADLTQWAQGSHRSEANVARNQYRHPVQTLEFLGVHPDMTVIELWPGGGWYTEILAPFLRDHGTFIAASFETEPKLDTPRNRYRAGAGKRYEQKLAASPSLYDKVQVVTFDPPTTTRLGVEASAHMVLTFRNLHNWAMSGDLQAVFEAAFEVLTPGGVFGVVEHRANPGMPAESGYMEQQKMIDLAKKVGFRLAASSEINANAKDSKDYPKGVWTLPPSLRLKELDKQKYLDIGESDRMTLKFYKPEI